MNRFEPPPLPGEDRPSESLNPYATPAAGGPASHTSQPYGSQPSATQHYGSQPYASQPYGAAPQAPWGPAASYAHPRGTTVLVLGILSIVLAGVFGPFAWVMGRKALREADAAPYPTSNRSTLQAGMVLGIIGTVFLVLGVLAMVFFVGIVMIAGSTTVST